MESESLATAPLGAADDQLKPCPFCGSADVRVHYAYNVAVECDCGARGPGTYMPYPAIAAWNQRAPLSGGAR